MQTIMAMIAAAGSLVGMLYTSILHWHEKTADDDGQPVLRVRKLLLLFTAIAALVLFACTLPSLPPFASGMRLGWGVLIGAALGCYALSEAGRGRRDADGTLNTIGMLSAGAMGPALALLIFHGYPNEVLIGCALGALLAAGIGAALVRPLSAVTEREIDAGSARGVELFALATVIAAVGARLAIAHFPRAHGEIPGGYWSLPSLFVALGALIFIVVAGAWLQKFDLRWRPLLCGALVSIILVVVLEVLQAKLLPALRWELAGTGMLVFAFVLAALRREEGEVAAFHPTALAFGAALLAVLTAAIAFRGLHGYGEILALLAVLPLVAMLSMQPDSNRAPEQMVTHESLTGTLGVGALTVLLLLTIYRLFLERSGRGFALDFQQQYDLLAVLLGVGSGFGLLGFTSGSLARARQVLAAETPRFAPLIARTVLLGVLLSGVPLALLGLWGTRGAGALLVGFIISEVVWMLLAAWSAGEARVLALAASPHVFLLGAALVTVQFTPLVLALSVTRTAKFIIVGILTLAAVLWVIADAWGQKSFTAASTATALPDDGGL